MPHHKQNSSPYNNVHRRCSAATVKSMKTETADENSPLCPKKDVPGLEAGGPPKLQRTIGVLSAIAIVFGNCVGAGIFISPRGVYEKTGSGGAGLVAWTLAGLIATMCTLAYAELGTMMPESGGEFVYINKVYGRFPAFIFSFCNAFLIKTAAMAVVAITFAEYFCSLIWIDTPTTMIKVVAASLIVLMGALNILSSTVIIKFCSVVSVLKLILVGFLLTCGVAIAAKGQGIMENFHPISSSFSGSSTNPTDYGLAFLFALFSFQSWNSLNFMTEELKEPTRTLPIGGGVGVLAVSLSYVLANVAYLLMFSVTEIINTNTIAMDSGFLAFGRIGEMTMCAGLLVSCIGCLGGSMFCISRNIQSTAEQDIFPRWMARINPTLNTPVPAIIVVVLSMCFYLLIDVTILIPCLGTVEWFFYAVTFSVLLYLRHKEPKTHRPIKVPLLMAIGLFIVTVMFVVLPLFSADSWMSVVIGLCSLPLAAVLYGVRHLLTKLFGSGYAPVEEGVKVKSVSESSSEDSGYQETFGRDNKVR